MKKTQKHKNVSTYKSKNVFNDLKKTFKRGQGLSNISLKNNYGVNLEQKESDEAVNIKDKRIIRISTYITRSASDLLDDLILKIKKKEHKKPKIADVLERAIEELHKNV